MNRTPLQEIAAVEAKFLTGNADAAGLCLRSPSSPVRFTRSKIFAAELRSRAPVAFFSLLGASSPGRPSCRVFAPRPPRALGMASSVAFGVNGGSNVFILNFLSQRRHVVSQHQITTGTTPLRVKHQGKFFRNERGDGMAMDQDPARMAEVNEDE
jgi:hypothetical protein